ncbi:hypothetical protein JTE90_015937 [Oedothorax gibbosus]|uniref:m7GpppN-mRNA hydrolase n=1 Tax=Oedothorax gibbosus TaxID=931172 RepID=A0AAV6TZU9_9ARAC|nr:hypothetical protein JTE90_015937 [Oedothorax gibbosus]
MKERAEAKKNIATKELRRMMEVVNSQRKAGNQFIPKDLLNDLSSRFIINVPEEERVDLIRLCFQIELAHWFYLDFYCEENPKLPKTALKDFIRIIFGHIPFLQRYTPSEVDTVLADWRDYKKAVPTYGAIILDQDLKNVLLVQSFVYKTSWGFPKGKVNKDEQPHHCAIREVLEETGFDITDLLDEDVYLEHHFNDQLIRLYIVTDVPSDAHFQPQTRCEIKGCEWFVVNTLPMRKDDVVKPNCLKPNNFFMVMPFVKQLKRWISSRMAELEIEALRQQQIFAQLTKNEYAKFQEGLATPSETRVRHEKNTYSPPPRMIKARKEKSKAQQPDDRSAKYNKKTNPDVSKTSVTKKPSTSNNTNDSFVISKTWQNFSLDCDHLTATFNISLRQAPLPKKTIKSAVF